MIRFAEPTRFYSGARHVLLGNQGDLAVVEDEFPPGPADRMARICQVVRLTRLESVAGPEAIITTVPRTDAAVIEQLSRFGFEPAGLIVSVRPSVAPHLLATEGRKDGSR